MQAVNTNMSVLAASLVSVCPCDRKQRGLGSWGCCGKEPPRINRWLKTPEMRSLPIVGSTAWNHGVGGAVLSVEVLGEGPSWRLPGLWWELAIAGIPRLVDVSLPSASVVTWCSLCVCASVLSSYWTHTDPVWSQQMMSTKALFLDKVTFWGSEWTRSLGDASQPSTGCKRTVMYDYQEAFLKGGGENVLAFPLLGGWNADVVSGA